MFWGWIKRNKKTVITTTTTITINITTNRKTDKEKGCQYFCANFFFCKVKKKQEKCNIFFKWNQIINNYYHHYKIDIKY